jgi:xylan 1,4-beta-xylosidase
MRVPIILSLVAGIVLRVLFPTLISAQTWTADNGNGTFTNPLFYDEFSDPDMIRVGDDYYFTGTTMHSMPGVPILHSRDLVNWDFLGYACDRLDFGPAYHLEGGKEIYGQGIWAPSFRYHNGTFYIFSKCERADDAAVPRDQPSRPVDAHEDEPLLPRPFGSVRR